MTLPTFPGAAVVYDRAARIASELNARAYAAQRAAYRRRTGFRFSPDATAEHIIAAMNRGDEETLKAVIAANLSIALGGAAS